MRGQARGAILGLLLLGACASGAPSKPTKRITYAENQCGGASLSWSGQNALGPESRYNRVSVAGTGFRWNGYPRSGKELRDMFLRARELASQPVVTVLVAESDADCREVRIARAQMDEVLSCGTAPNCAGMSDNELRKIFPADIADQSHKR